MNCNIKLFTYIIYRVLILQLIEKRIGIENYLDKLGEIGKHEAYNKALKHPQLKCSDFTELIFDNKFCQNFKHLEHVVIQVKINAVKIFFQIIKLVLLEIILFIELLTCRHP